MVRPEYGSARARLTQEVPRAPLPNEPEEGLKHKHEGPRQVRLLV